MGRIIDHGDDEDATKTEAGALTLHDILRAYDDNTERAIKVLTSARGLIEKGWTQEAEARDNTGRPVPPAHATAVEFCIVGACCREFAGPLVAYELAQLQATLTRRWSVFTLTSFNDYPVRTKDEVLALFDETIEHLKETS